MSLRKKIIFFLIGVCLIPQVFARKVLPSFWSPVGPYKASSEPIRYKSLELSVQGTSFSTTAHYDVNGQVVNLAADESFSMLDADLVAGYGVSKRFDIKTMLKWRKNDSESGGYANSASGIESIALLGKIAFLPISRWHYAIEGLFRQKAYSNQKYTSGRAPRGELVLGDDGYEMAVIGHLNFHRTKNHILGGYLGYNIPPEQLSHEVLYNLENAWVLNKWAFLLGLDGILSMQGDEYSDTPAQKPSISSGSTYLFNSVNRERILPYLGVNVVLGESWRVMARAGQVISGVSTDEGYEIKFGITWTSAESVKRKIKVGAFKEYNAEAIVIKVSPRGLFVKIDKGMSENVEKGQTVDIYKMDYFGGNLLVATGIVYDAGPQWSIVKIMKRYQKIPIKEGFTGRVK
ncbi:MAG: hypothetical protein KAQ98_06375 [Bacteriovoracaceae bacterium]|nr:hypothetical protein [Bacteriovoracaceae bacterium]